MSKSSSTTTCERMKWSKDAHRLYGKIARRRVFVLLENAATTATCQKAFVHENNEVWHYDFVGMSKSSSTSACPRHSYKNAEIVRLVSFSQVWASLTTDCQKAFVSKYRSRMWCVIFVSPRLASVQMMKNLSCIKVQKLKTMHSVCMSRSSSTTNGLRPVASTCIHVPQSDSQCTRTLSRKTMRSSPPLSPSCN